MNSEARGVGPELLRFSYKFLKESSDLGAGAREAFLDDSPKPERWARNCDISHANSLRNHPMSRWSQGGRVWSIFRNPRGDGGVRNLYYPSAPSGLGQSKKKTLPGLRRRNLRIPSGIYIGNITIPDPPFGLRKIIQKRSLASIAEIRGFFQELL